MPSRRGRDVPSSHKKNEYGVMIGNKEEREETQPRAEQEASMRKRKRTKGIKRELATRGTKMQRSGKIV